MTKVSIVSKKKRRVLADHQQKGKRFVPPMLQIGKFESVRWQLPVLPELVWLALLNDYHGFQKGAEVALLLARSANKIAHGNWFATISAYGVLTGEQQSQVLDDLNHNGKIEALRRPLAGFLWYYPQCPLKFLFPRGVNHLEAGALLKFKSVLAELFYRTERPAMLVQANAIYIALVTGPLKIPKGSALANLQEIANYPETKESQRVGSMVRATINGLFGAKYDGSAVWPSYFWKRGLELEKCDYQSIEQGAAL